MGDPIDPWRRGERALEAYYYSFDPTGVREVDGILAAVALAGKSYHHTQDWNEADRDEESLVDCIQRHAGIAAERVRALERKPTPADIAAWLNQHPDEVAEVLARAYVADAWREEYAVWSRRLVGDDADDFAMVDFDEEADRWVVELRDVEHDDDYATAAEAMAAADKALVEDGYALVGGVPE